MSRNPGCTAAEEWALVQRVRTGDEAAFTDLAKRYESLLCRLSDRCALRAADRDDLRQEGLLGLLSAAQTFRADGEASFSTYAAVCIRRRMLSLVRRAYWRREVLSEDGEDVAVPPAAGQAAEPERIVLERDDERRLHERLRSKLSPLEYSVLCAHLDGDSYEEVAEKLGITRKAVDNAIQRIRRKLSPR